MSLVPYKKDNWWFDPFFEMEKIQDQMNKLFDFSLSRNPFAENTLLGGQWSPAVDIYDSNDNILVKADLPGLTKDQIEVSVENNNLILKGEKSEDTNIKQENYFRTERFYGSFFRTIPLQAEVDADKVEAKYQEGVLTLKLPKKEVSKPKKIIVDVK